MKKERSSEGFLQRIRLAILKSSGRRGSCEGIVKADYNEYTLTLNEIILYGAEAIALIILISYIFYRSFLAVFLLSPTIILFLDHKRKRRIKSEKEKLTLQFREMMHSVIAGLQAGYSVENAFEHSYDDLILLYGRDEIIPKEIEVINRNLRNNHNLEEVLTDLAERTHVKDIADFAEVFRIAKRSGGDLTAILGNTAEAISDRIEVRREIAVGISDKKMEQKIMDLVPFGIIFYIDATSPGFFEPLYHNPGGVALMTVMLGVYIFAFLLGEKILDIRY
ncbi:MAG: type II secretion system F family protein [Lachnospiraceae bacterium]|nr:type II secretion system F family protein [Lachnospiraceae bacterium]